jgi:hypothetical protein
MTGLVWTEIDRGTLQLPQEAEKSVFDADVAHWSQNLQLWDGWSYLSESATRLGIRLLLVKGVAIESRFFSRTGERPCSDLDVLVDEAGIAQLEDLLAGLSVEPETAKRTARLAQRGIIQSATAYAGTAPVDLHFDLLKTGLPAVDPGAFWDTAVTATGPVGSYRTLGPETSLLQLLIHLNRDRFRRLLGYVDIQRIVASNLVEWSRFWSIAHREGLEVIASESLRAVGETLQLAVGQLPRGRLVRRTVWRFAWPNRIRLRGRDSLFRFGRRAQILFPFLTVSRERDAFTATIRRLFPDREHLAYLHREDPTRPYLLDLVRARRDDLISRLRSRRELNRRSRTS